MRVMVCIMRPPLVGNYLSAKCKPAKKHTYQSANTNIIRNRIFIFHSRLKVLIMAFVLAFVAVELSKLEVAR